jgi:hypothetical protein
MGKEPQPENGKRRTGGTEDEPRRRESPGATSYDVTFRELLKLYREIAADGAAPQVTDAITQALLTVLGSGPSFAALESLVSANQANGLMYHNSVAAQQRTNILSMVATTKCVNALLGRQARWPTADLEDDDDDQA